MTKCINLCYRARIVDRHVIGRIGFDEDGYVALLHNGIKPWRGNSVEEIMKIHLMEDFEIVPRDPETYKDWQVGDVIEDSNGIAANGRIIFRSGKFVAADINGCVCRTCRELFDEGYRLVLTDIEQQIIEKKKKYEPQDGDICYAKSTSGYYAIFVYNRCGLDRKTDFYVSFDSHGVLLSSGYAIDPRCLEERRPATDKEKQLLFDAMAKQGKRWNAEKKVVEDIPKPHEFKKGEPVLVRNGSFEKWCIAAYCKPEGITNRVFVGDAEAYFVEVIPYNEKTMHLLGTTEDYKEE